jgi:hypothetical protein
MRSLRRELLWFALVLSISPRLSLADSPQRPYVLNGTWISSSYEDHPYNPKLNPKIIWTRTLTVKLPNFKYSVDYFDPSSKKKVLNVTSEGTMAVSPDSMNPAAFDVDLTLSKSTLLIVHAAPILEKSELSDCARPSVPANILAKKCGAFSFMQGIKSLYYVILPLSEKAILLSSSFLNHAFVMPTTPEARTLTTYIGPLIR